MHNLLATWASVYSNSALLKTALGFAHLGGLLVAGGGAIAADRAVLTAPQDDADERRRHLAKADATHRYVIAGLVAVMLSGVLLCAADLDTYLASRVFWLKMGLIVVLLGNGLLLARAERAAKSGAASGWPRLRRASVASLALWLITTFLGAALPNV